MSTPSPAPLWAKGSGQRHPAVHNYIISKNMADYEFIPHDIRGSIAHATMLGDTGIITSAEAQQLTTALQKLLTLHADGEWTIDLGFEDVHSAVERWLTEQIGDVGKKLHTSRSRNDQVLVDMRMWTKESLDTIITAAQATTEALLTYAEQYHHLPMPGFTHTQPAMPSSVGQWASSFAECLLDDIAGLRHAYFLNDQNPLGSAAGFGTGFPIDRQRTTQLLGFDRVQVNPMACQLSRGKIEAATIHALGQVMLTLSRLANDIVWFMNPAHGLFQMSVEFTTGSSIMPQKRNPDIWEVMRGKTGVILSLAQRCQMLGFNLPSGYNKDTKFTKRALMEACTITLDSLQITTLALPEVTPNEANLRAAMLPELYATDIANQLVAEGMPFRDAYKKIGEDLGSVIVPDIDENLKNKTHLGATGNLGLDILRQRLAES